MAFTRTNRVQSISAASYGTASFVSGSFTPSSNSMLLVWVFGLTNGDGGMTGFTISGGSLSYTQRLSVVRTDTFGTFLLCYSAPVAVGASMSITVDATNNIYGWAIDVEEYPGGITFGTTGSSNNSGDPGALTYNLAGTPASSSHVIAGLSLDFTATGGTVSEAAGWATVWENTTVWGVHLMDDQTAPDNSIEYTDTYSGTPTSYSAAAIEIKAPPEGGAPQTDLVGPGSTGPLAWQWRQRYGVDPPSSVPLATFTARVALGIAARDDMNHIGLGRARAPLGLAARDGTLHLGVTRSRVPLGLAARDANLKRALGTSRVPLGLAARDAARKIALSTGRVVLGLAVRAKTSVVGIVTFTARVVLGIALRDADRKIAVGTARAPVGLAARDANRKIAKGTARVPLGLAARDSLRKIAKGTGRVIVGLAARITAGALGAIIVGPAIKRVYELVARTVARLDGRKVYDQPAQTVTEQDGRRTYIVDGNTTEDIL